MEQNKVVTKKQKILGYLLLFIYAIPITLILFNPVDLYIARLVSGIMIYGFTILLLTYYCIKQDTNKN